MPGEPAVTHDDDILPPAEGGKVILSPLTHVPAVGIAVAKTSANPFLLLYPVRFNALAGSAAPGVLATHATPEIVLPLSTKEGASMIGTSA